MRKQEQKGKITALYERLSHDDGQSDESVSVENQKRIRVAFGNLICYTIKIQAKEFINMRQGILK